jgi:subfamily B ATP-binding cassette protein HlyB/CyaB
MTKSTSTAESSALHALCAVVRRMGIDVTYGELQRNYALTETEPKTSVLIAIAKDLGIEARAIKIKFKDLPRLGKSLPAIIRVTGGACLVLEGARVDPGAGPIAILRDPTIAEEALTAVDEEKLAKVWKGEVILLKRKYGATDEEQPFGFAWLMGQVLREKRLFMDISVAAVVSTLFALAPPFIFMIVVNRVLANHSISTLNVLAGGMLMIILFEMILTFFRRKLMEVATTRIDGRLSLYIVERMLRLPLDYFERNATGLLLSKIGRVSQIRNFLTGQLFGAFLDAVPLLGLIPAMMLLNFPLTMFVLACAGIVFLIITAFLRPLGRQYRKVILAEQRRHAHLVETMQGMRTIKALAIEGRRRREWDGRVAETVQARYDLGVLSAYPHVLALPFERLIYAGSFILGAYMVLTLPNSSMSIGAIGAFALLAMRLGQPLIQMARLQLELAEVRGAIAEVAETMNIPAEDSRGATGMRPTIRGEFVFKDVSFRYTQGAPYALDRVSFTVPAGTVVGIMGRSGSGKSTITRLIQRLYTGFEGLIKLDGLDLREMHLGHLRSSIGVVLPENFLFQGTIRENIGIARPDATLEQIVRAAQLAGAEEFIERMPKGYETVLEENATNLSSGQRQRLAIARALITDPQVLILDEATSALDAESEAIINANLRRIAQGRTVITISHRLSMLVDSDAIMVMERGKLYDMGTHDELLDRCDIYKQLWHQQNRHAERTSRTAPPPLAIGRARQ